MLRLIAVLAVISTTAHAQPAWLTPEQAAAQAEFEQHRPEMEQLRAATAKSLQEMRERQAAHQADQRRKAAEQGVK